MLTSLYIKNYALIDELNVDFNTGLTIITGETGAGKSILLGALSLILGKRADLSQVKDNSEKCIIEGVFDVANYNLSTVFKALDIDYDVQTIIRREILPSGKSRAFINDSPVTLDTLTSLSNYLIDIHSQNQTQQLTQDDYQFKVIDALAKNQALLDEFSSQLKAYKVLKRDLEQLKRSKAESIKEYDYNVFLFEELNKINLETLNLNDLETQFEELNNVELINEKLNSAKLTLSSENVGISDLLNNAKNDLSKIVSFGQSYDVLHQRLMSAGIELLDILDELDALQENLTTDPQILEDVNAKLQVLHNLFQKHAVTEIEDLLRIKTELNDKIEQSEGFDEAILEQDKKITQSKAHLQKLAKEIHKKRDQVIPGFIKNLELILKDLGMPNAKFKIELHLTESFTLNGKDHLEFLFVANKGSNFNSLKKAASGGELSRIMLAIKSIMANYVQLPSIMFDEIDTGVSGEISKKMGAIMKEMSRSMQVFAITHLPQIAAKGDSHFKVYKTDHQNSTRTELKKLPEEERIVEIAQMLGGLSITESALAHARQLLN